MDLVANYSKTSKSAKRQILPLFRKASKQPQLPPPEYTPQAPSPSPPRDGLLTPPPNELQIIENRYIDHEKLLKICEQRFGLGNYRLKYKSKRYYLSVPALLDEDIIESCDIYYEELGAST